MEGKRKAWQSNSLVKFCHFCSSCLKVLTSKKKLNNHIVEIDKDLVTPKAPNHLPLAELPCLPEQCNHCFKNFQKVQPFFTNVGGPWSKPILKHSGHVFVCKCCGNRFMTNNSINRHKKLLVTRLNTGRASATSPCGKGKDKGRGEEKDNYVQLQKESSHPLPSQLDIYYLVV